MKRVVVHCSIVSESTNQNNAVGLDPFVSYTILDHIMNLADDGIFLLKTDGALHYFSDGSARMLCEREEEIDEAALDAETTRLMQSASAETEAA